MSKHLYQITKPQKPMVSVPTIYYCYYSHSLYVRLLAPCLGPQAVVWSLQYGNVSNKHNSQINFSNKLKMQTVLNVQTEIEMLNLHLLLNSRQQISKPNLRLQILKTNFLKVFKWPLSVFNVAVETIKCEIKKVFC